MRTQAGDVLIMQEHFARSGGTIRKSCSRRCFACTIPSNQRHDFAFVNRQRNAFEGVDFAIIGMQVFNF